MNDMDYIKRQAGKLRKCTVHSLLLYHRGLLGNIIRWVFRPEPPGLNNRVVEMVFVGVCGKTTLPGRDGQELETIGGLQAPVSGQTHSKKGRVGGQ